MENPQSDILIPLYEEEKKLLSRLIAVRNAIKALGGNISQDVKIEDRARNFKPLKIPDQWSAKLTKVEKIAYAIKELGGEGTSSEIAEKIASLEGSVAWLFDGSAVEKRNVIMLVSYLYKKGQLKVNREGGKNIYRFI